MSTTRPKTRAARSAYAVFSDTDFWGKTIHAKVAVQFWQQREDGSWAGMVADKNGLADAQSFHNFVNFQSAQRKV